jgi:aldehyde dehydrogenase (NAD+)
MTSPIIRDKLYINGQWIASNGKGMIDVVDPSTEGVYAQIPEGTVEDATAAVLAARAAFDSWSSLAPSMRADYLDKVAAGLKARSADLATAIACEVGMPIKMASMVQVAGPVWNWGNYAKLARTFELR